MPKKKTKERTVNSLILEMVDDFSQLEGNLKVIDTFFLQLIENGQVEHCLEIDIVGNHLDLLQEDLTRYKKLINRLFRQIKALDSQKKKVS